MSIFTKHQCINGNQASGETDGQLLHLLVVVRMQMICLLSTALGNLAGSAHKRQNQLGSTLMLPVGVGCLVSGGLLFVIDLGESYVLILHGAPTEVLGLTD
jgi:hypothetical protein